MNEKIRNTHITVFWFRRDLRTVDNAGLYRALKNNEAVLPLFIFDDDILGDLQNKYDKRVEFIHRELKKLHKKMEDQGSTILVKHGKPLDVWREIIKDYDVIAVYANKDYEPYAITRDKEIKALLEDHNIKFHLIKDQVIFEENDILKDDGDAYSVYTPYKNNWLDKLNKLGFQSFPSENNYHKFLNIEPYPLIELERLGFRETGFNFPSDEIDRDTIASYHKTRDFPGMDGTTRLGIHLRFGTISIRKLVEISRDLNKTFLGELIWREFFMMILFHHPNVVDRSFKKKYDNIQWINSKDHFQRWCEGKTGYPIVDAGMQELIQTGYMHNRLRMITASFLVKHLLIDWRWGERYFAEKLLDYELSSNNGNWQWAAGCGCDAAPYFRIFNPETQMKKYDRDKKYIKKWLPEYQEDTYIEPVVDHKYARERALSVYKEAL
jgi:deoxyribodipyrimidine photo-lyase